MACYSPGPPLASYIEEADHEGPLDGLSLRLHNPAAPSRATRVRGCGPLLAMHGQVYPGPQNVSRGLIGAAVNRLCGRWPPACPWDLP